MTKPFADDSIGVPDEMVLFRRVDWDRVGGPDRVAPGETPLLTRNCFTDYPRELARQKGYPDACMSVGADPVLRSHGYRPEKMLENYAGYGLAEIRAGDLRQLTRLNGDPCPQGVMLWPTPEEAWHAVVFELDPASRPRKKGVQAQIAVVARWTIPLVRS